MPGNADPSRIYHDPALTDRRGDATGPGALLFLFLLVAGFAAVAVGLVSLPALVVDPTPGPATPAPIATVRPTATPALTSAPDASAEPGLTDAPGASSGPDASSGPLRTHRPRPTDTGRPPAVGVIGQMNPVFRNDKRVGGVAVRSFQVGDLPGVTLPTGARVMVLEVRYSTANGMDYDAADWVMVDSDGKRHASLGDQAPLPALGSGTLDAGGSITGNVAFIREPGTTFDQIVLTDGNGHDLVTVDRNSSSATTAP